MRTNFTSGLVFAEGKTWKKHRKVVSMAFHYNLLREMAPQIVKISQEFIAKMKEKDMNNINIMNEFQAMTGEIVGRLFFGEAFANYKLNGQSATDFLAKFVQDMGSTQITIGHILFGYKYIKLGLFKSHRELFKSRDIFFKFCRDIIIKRMKQMEAERNEESAKEGKNMLELFFDLKKKNPEDTLNESEIIDEFVTFFIAGMDTTGHLISMASYYLL